MGKQEEEEKEFKSNDIYHDRAANDYNETSSDSESDDEEKRNYHETPMGPDSPKKNAQMDDAAEYKYDYGDDDDDDTSSACSDPDILYGPIGGVTKGGPDDDVLSSEGSTSPELPLNHMK